MTLIRDVPAPSVGDLLQVPRLPQDHSSWEKKMGRPILTGSGKAAIALVLRYLRSIGILSVKMDEVLVSQWLGYWVYNQINEFARPALSPSKSTKVIMPYHQYGFPQKMEEIQEFAESIGAVVVEDCAHALWMEGSLLPHQSGNNFRIYSFSKYFFCYALGAVAGGGDAFQNFANKQIDESSGNITFFNNLIKWLSEQSVSKKIPQFELWDYLLLMSYAIYGKGLKPGHCALRLMVSKIDAEIEIRRERYHSFKKEFQNLEVEHYLGDKDVSPYVIPLKLPADSLVSLAASLQEADFGTGIYYFDVNRNLLNPRFEKVLWVLLHSGISDTDYHRQLEIIKKGI